MNDELVDEVMGVHRAFESVGTCTPVMRAKIADRAIGPSHPMIAEIAHATG